MFLGWSRLIDWIELIWDALVYQRASVGAGAFLMAF